MRHWADAGAVKTQGGVTPLAYGDARAVTRPIEERASLTASSRALHRSVAAMSHVAPPFIVSICLPSVQMRQVE